MQWPSCRPTPQSMTTSSAPPWRIVRLEAIVEGLGDDEMGLGPGLVYLPHDRRRRHVGRGGQADGDADAASMTTSATPWR